MSDAASGNERIQALEQALSQARLELAHVSRVASLGVLTAAIAHEVNQPLSGILANASACLRMLAADAPNLERARETARRTIRDCNRASEVITRLRRLFAKGGGAMEEVDLGEVAVEVIALARFELHRNQVDLRLELADDLPSIAGDRVQLQQVILNLVLNACEAMQDVHDRPRALTIRTECGADRCVRLSVKDAGIGIEPKAVDQLFEPFYTTKPGGMGIGLCVSQTIVEGHHGHLRGEGNANEPGATFSLAFGSRA